MDNNESRDKNKRHKRYISLRKNFKYTTKIKHQNVESQNIDLNFCAYAFAYTYKIEKIDKWESSGFEQVDKTGFPLEYELGIMKFYVFLNQMSTINTNISK